MSQQRIHFTPEIKGHILYSENRVFSKFEAWFDMLLSVNEHDTLVEMYGTTIEVKRGQVVRSLEAWGLAWGWERTKVFRFLKKLTDAGLIETKKVEGVQQRAQQQAQQLTICNYDDYSDKRNNDRNNDRNTEFVQTSINFEPEKSTSKTDELIILRTEIERLKAELDSLKQKNDPVEPKQAERTVPGMAKVAKQYFEEEGKVLLLTTTDRTAIKKITAKILAVAKANGADVLTDQQVCESFATVLKRLKNVDVWMYNNLTLSLLASKLENIISKMRNPKPENQNFSQKNTVHDNRMVKYEQMKYDLLQNIASDIAANAQA